MMGVIISSAVLPATLTLVWAGQNKWAACLSPILGLIAALIAWLVTAKKDCGDLTVTCTGSNNPMLAGNVVALLSPVVLIAVLTLAFGLVSDRARHVFHQDISNNCIPCRTSMTGNQ